MVKKVSRINLGQIRPMSAQLEWIGVTHGEYVIIEDDASKHGKFLSIYKPTKAEDKDLVKDYKERNENGE